MALRFLRAIGSILLLLALFHATGGFGKDDGPSTVHSQRKSSVWYKVTEANRSLRPKSTTPINKPSFKPSHNLKIINITRPPDLPHSKPFESDRQTNGYIAENSKPPFKEPRSLFSCKNKNFERKQKKKTKKKKRRRDLKSPNKLNMLESNTGKVNEKSPCSRRMESYLLWEEDFINTCFGVLLFLLINYTFNHHNAKANSGHLRLPVIFFLLLVFLMLPQLPDKTPLGPPLWIEVTDNEYMPTMSRKRKAVEVLQNQAKRKKYNTGKKRKNQFQNENSRVKRKQKTGVITYQQTLY